MIDLQSAWPYALAAVVLLALVILVLLLLLLRRSAKASEFKDAEEPEPAPVQAEPEEKPGTEIQAKDGAVPFASRLAFNRAGRRLDQAAAGDRHRVPFFLMLGAEGSRDADFLAEAGMELPFGAPAEAGMSLGRGRGFWFLDRGVVLDLAGDAVLDADGRSADEGTWRAALHQLQKLRPKRPADGIILTVSCKQLLEAQASERALDELAARSGRIYRKLWQMQQKLGFRLPVYLLVTGCEELDGFSTLSVAVPSRLQGEMLGWSSPYSVDSAYQTGWVDAAFTSIGGRMDDLQMEVFTAPPAETPEQVDSLFLLPAAVRSLKNPVRAMLDQLFKPSAYHESLALRGIWLCGREEAPEGAPRKTFFVKDLLNEKVFREAALAVPTSQTVVNRNRAVRIAQIATVTAALLFGGGLLWANYSLGHQEAVLEEFLGDTLEHLRQVRQMEHENIKDAELRSWTVELLQGMSKIDFNRFGSVFLPSSWLSPFQDRLENAMSASFEQIILQAIGRELTEEGQSLAETAALYESSPVLTSTGSGALVKPIHQMTEFAAFQRYVHRARELEKYGRVYNRLPQSRDLKPLAELVKFSFGETLPDTFFNRADLYLIALRRAKYEPFAPVQFRGNASRHAESLAANFYAALYRRSPLAARLESLALGLQVAAVQRPVAGETERFEALVKQMEDVDAALSGTELEWAFRREFNLGPEFNQVLAEMRQSDLFDDESIRRIESAGASGWSSFQRYLASEGSPLTGTILAVQDGRAEMQLSSDTLLLQTALKAFLGQGFVADAGGRRIQIEVPPGTRLTWDPVLLDQAAALATAYERFRDKGLKVLPAELQPALDAVALDRTEAQAEDMIGRAQRFEPLPPAVSLTLLEDEVQAGIRAFEASARPTGELADALGRVRLEKPRRDLSAAMTSEAFRLLSSVDRLLEAEEPYRPRLGGFGWWDGSDPVSPAAWGTNDPAEVAVYLETTRARITVLSRSYAQPLLTWIARGGVSEEPPEVRTLAGKWQVMLDDLRDYDAKKPGNPTAALEDYIVNRMPKVETRSCSSAAAPAVMRPARSLFASSLYDLSRQLSTRCYTLAGGHALELYAETARYFNQRLAGRYPFSAQPPGPSVPEADPDDIRAFFRLYDRSAGVVRAVPEAGAQGSTLKAARKFVDDMARVRAFFAPFLDAEKPQPVPSFDVEAAFRVLRDREVGANHIIGWALEVGGDRITDRDTESRKIRWTVGEPVRIILRWASDGPQIPVLPSPRAGATVRDRTLVYEYANRWSLLAAVADHRAPLRDLPAYADRSPVTLALAVHTQPANGGPPGEAPTQVFLRMTVLAPDKTELLDPPGFPDRAPMPDDPTVEDVL
ncbi:MAG TPA: type VI secretion protein IcmF/TssM N-terminal domain-containing protein [Thermoanaerobaculia bacterium]|nr:type VI secretion protein IcmF/TssM N-terminal domain-containing protein [Thermoanaerobaculia bacterium]